MVILFHKYISQNIRLSFTKSTYSSKQNTISQILRVAHFKQSYQRNYIVE